MVVFRALEDAFDKIKSMNLGFFWEDEITEIGEDIHLALVGRLRRKGVWHTGFGTTNPEGHDWVWKHAIAGKPVLRRWDNGTFLCEGDDTFLVTSTSDENPYLPYDYVPTLRKNYPPEWVKRYVDGSFDTFSGLVYGEFKDEKPCVIKPFDIPKGWYRFVALDYGYRNPTAVLWFAVSPKGIAYVYDEFYSSGKLVSELAEIIKAKTGSAKVQMHLGDPSMGNKNGITGRSVLDEFADAGVVIQKANNSVSAGINRVKERLKDRTLVIFSNCTNLRTELQTYKWKDLKPGAVQDGPEKPVKRGDHACDALRYGTVYLYDTPIVKQKSYAFDYQGTKNEQEPSSWMAA
jgi:PBSX family phage terminase large subunit